MSGGAGFYWDIPQAVGAVTQGGDYDLVMFKKNYVKLGEDGDAVVIAKLSHGYEGACGDVVEDVGGLRFGRKFV